MQRLKVFHCWCHETGEYNGFLILFQALLSPLAIQSPQSFMRTNYKLWRIPSNPHIRWGFSLHTEKGGLVITGSWCLVDISPKYLESYDSSWKMETKSIVTAPLHRHKHAHILIKACTHLHWLISASSHTFTRHAHKYIEITHTCKYMHVHTNTHIHKTSHIHLDTQTYT